MIIENWIYTKTIITKIFSEYIIKAYGAMVFLCCNVLFDGLLSDGLVALLLLIIFDAITAIAVAYKTGKEIKSSKILRTAIKIAVYFLLISSGKLAETSAPILTIIDETILGFLAITELISILENAGKMGYAIPQRLLNKLQEIQKEK